MIKIRRLTYFDRPKIKKLISYLGEDANFDKSLAEEPAGFINAMCPLALKFRPESFILIDGKEILGLITTVCTPGNPYRINISRLIFKQNNYEAGKHLVNFVVQKQGSKGANSFYVTVEDCHTELLDLFINGCGFRHCSSETLWKIEYPAPVPTEINWRYAQNSDSRKIAKLFNSELANIFKSSLKRHRKEFENRIFQGFQDNYKNRYVTESAETLTGYYSITTSDNLNYILDFVTNSNYDLDYDSIINKMMCEIARKRKAFFPIIKQRKYMNNSEKFENYLNSKGYNPIQTHQILTKEFYRTSKETSNDWAVFSLGENQISS